MRIAIRPDFVGRRLTDLRHVGTVVEVTCRCTPRQALHYKRHQGPATLHTRPFLGRDVDGDLTVRVLGIRRGQVDVQLTLRTPEIL